MQIEFGGDFFQRWHFVEAKAVEISLLLGSEEGLTLESSAFFKNLQQPLPLLYHTLIT